MATTFEQPKSLFYLFMIICSFLIISLPMSADALCNSIDKNALLEIKARLGPNASFFASWQPNTDCCQSWFNVGCNNRTHRVNYLTIGGQDTGLSGQIPPAVGDLTGLEVLYFNDLPGLTGPIPSTISKLTNLQDLEFFRTNLTGRIPSSLARLKNVEILDLSENRLSGPIPASLSLMTSLQGLNLAKNELSGSIPESFSSFKNLAFQAQENQLSGPIPQSLGQAGFSWLNISSNHLSGDASFLFGKDKKAILIELQNNAFSFDLSKVEFPSGLKALDLSHNMIYGSLPNQLAKLPLQVFDVSYNQLCGPIPAGKWVNQFGANAFEHNKCLCGAPLAPCK